MGIVKNELPIAGWHRGLSVNQIKAATELKSAVTYDWEDDSADYVYDCIVRLGISPMINRSSLSRIIQLSRGHHLTFLYFLVLDHYKSLSSAFEPLESKYSVNEQLLLSALAYLDMPATLKELDRILPKNVKPTIKKNRTLKRKRVRKENRNSLPYFQKQPRPKQISLPNKFLCTPPTFAAEIGNDQEGRQEDYKDSWTANYELQPIKRMVKSLIAKELELLFGKIDKFRDTSSSSVSTSPNLERLEFLINQRNRCLAMIDLEGERKMLSRDRVLTYLKNDVERYLQKFDAPHSELTGCQYLRTPSIEKPLLLLDGTGEGNCRPGLIVKGRSNKDSSSSMNNHVKVFSVEHNCIGDTRKHSPNLCPRLLKTGNCFRTKSKTVRDPLPKSSSDTKYFDAPQSLGKHFPNLCPRLLKTGNCFRKKGKTVRNPLPESSSDTKYFKAPQSHVPHLFNYRDIFHGPCKIQQDAGHAIRSALVKALGKPNETQVCVAHFKAIQRQNIMDAVTQCVQNIFQKALLEKEEPKVIPTVPNFDPNDEHLMEQMLYDAMKELRKNQKFVLASLPQSHQVPELREWTRRRYGKRYKAQTFREFNATIEDMMNIAKMDRRLLPTSLPGQHLGNDFISYMAAHRGQLFKKVDNYGKNFKMQFNNMILDRSRLCWHALHHLRTPNNKSLHLAYFTYVPGCAADMQPTKGVWLPGI